jgi:hypothetical protein
MDAPPLAGGRRFASISDNRLSTDFRVVGESEPGGTGGRADIFREGEGIGEMRGETAFDEAGLGWVGRARRRGWQFGRRENSSSGGGRGWSEEGKECRQGGRDAHCGEEKSISLKISFLYNLGCVENTEKKREEDAVQEKEIYVLRFD